MWKGSMISPCANVFCVFSLKATLLVFSNRCGVRHTGINYRKSEMSNEVHFAQLIFLQELKCFCYFCTCK